MIWGLTEEQKLQIRLGQPITITDEQRERIDRSGPIVLRSDPLPIQVVSGSHLKSYRGLPGEDRLRPRIVSPECTTRYTQRIKRDDDNFIEEFIIINPVGPVHRVFTLDADGNQYVWGCRDTWSDRWGRVLIFYPHPAYKGGGITYNCSPECVAEPLREAQTTLWSFGSQNGNSSGVGGKIKNHQEKQQNSL